MDRLVLKVWISPIADTAQFFAPTVFSQSKTEYWREFKNTINFLDTLNTRLGERVAHYELFIINPFSYDYNPGPFHWYDVTQDASACLTEQETKLKNGKIKKTQYNHFQNWADATLTTKERQEFFAFLIRGGIKNVKALLHRGEKLPKVTSQEEEEKATH